MKKKIIIGAIAILFIAIFAKATLYNLTYQKEVETDVSIGDHLNQLKESIQGIDVKTESIHLSDAIPFEWDTCYYFKENTDLETIKKQTGLTNLMGSFKPEFKTVLLFKDRKIVCVINDSSDNLGFELTLKNQNEQCKYIQKTDGLECIVSRTGDKATLQIQNEENQVTKKYSSNESDPSVVNENAGSVKKYKVTEINIDKIVMNHVSMTKENIPVSFDVSANKNGKDMLYDCYYNKEKNNWSFENPRNTNMSTRSGEYIEQTGGWFKGGSQTEDIVQMDANGKEVRTIAPYTDRRNYFVIDVKLINEELVAISVYESGDYKMIIYNMTEKKIIRVYTGGRFMICKVEDNMVYATANHEYLYAFDITKSETIAKIPLKGIKLTDENIDTNTEDVNLYQVAVTKGKVFLACGIGVYQWNDQISKWELVLRNSDDENYVKKSKDKVIGIIDFFVTSDEEFYIRSFFERKASSNKGNVGVEYKEYFMNYQKLN